MPAAITADQLLARIKARAQIPATEGRLTDPEILALADDALLLSLGREMYDADDGRWIRTAADVGVTSGTSEYRIPERAWSSGVDAVSLVDARGNEIPLGYVDRSEIAAWDQSGVWQSPCFTILGDKIRLLPVPTDSAYSLRVRYVRRPSRLVLLEEASQVTSIAGSSWSTITLSTWDASVVLDYIHGQTGDSLADSVSTAFNFPNFTPSTMPAELAVGDYACLAGESCVVQVPDVAIPYLADLVARDACVALGDNEGADRCAGLAEQRRRDVSQALAERSRTRPKVVNHHSPLRATGTRRRRLWGLS